MTNALILYELHKNEIECTLSTALESPFMEDPLYLWIVSGQYLQNQTDFLKADALTYVAPSFNKKDRYSVCTSSGKTFFPFFKTIISFCLPVKNKNPSLSIYPKSPV